MTSQRVHHNIHFFKVILESNLRNGDLRVPKSFAWKGMTNPVSLRLPNHTEWKVYWIKRDGDVWFLNGWKEFAEYLSLEAAQFLMFQHEGKSQFKVIVFGKSSLEIKYPSSIGNVKKVEEVDGSDCSLEIVVDGKRQKYSSSSQSCKKLKTNIKEEPECYAEMKNDVKKAPSGFDIDDMSKALLEKVKNTFRSENHFFICRCQRTYTERDILNIPKGFLKHLHRKVGNATLSVKERSWDIRMKFSSYKQASFCEGWRTFSQDNNLKLGDVCVFVLLKFEGISFEVVIFRIGEQCSTLFAEDYRLHQGLHYT